MQFVSEAVAAQVVSMGDAIEVIEAMFREYGRGDAKVFPVVLGHGPDPGNCSLQFVRVQSQSLSRGAARFAFLFQPSTAMNRERMRSQSAVEGRRPISHLRNLLCFMSLHQSSFGVP
jgi:hypothetical protein